MYLTFIVCTLHSVFYLLSMYFCISVTFLVLFVFEIKLGWTGLHTHARTFSPS